jgi:predicted short-subunit dehydrogenase-like oxidoreductase (DUF2520 family)
MRELERDPPSEHAACLRIAIVGPGRLGHALARALASAPGQFEPVGPLGPGADGRQADAVLLCVPDRQIATAAALISPGPLVGHCSGATGLEPLFPHEAFSLHPLMTVTHGDVSFEGAGAALDGTSQRALRLAEELARAVGLRPVRVRGEDRALYHAAASVASNFLLTVEAAAERLASLAGVDRELLVPLVRASVENWARLGPARALTGPVARGDEETVERQRAAIAEHAADLLPLFDALVAGTRSLAAAPRPLEVTPA